MMYNNKLVVAVKANGKVLRELKDTVYVPFGTEYSLLIKNLDSVRVQVRIKIDGTDTTEGTWLIVPAKGELELERFIKSGNMDKGNRFKFIERTAAIETGPRGIGVTDGIIEVDFQFEKRVPKIEHVTKIERIHHYYEYYPNYFYQPLWLGAVSQAKSDDSFGSPAVFSEKAVATRNVSLGNLAQSASLSATPAIAQNATSQALFATQQVNDTGITVEGSVSEQKFKTVEDIQVEAEMHTIVLKMLGETEQGKQIVEPVTVKAKPKCKTCGRTNKANAKFCTECGTALIIV